MAEVRMQLTLPIAVSSFGYRAGEKGVWFEDRERRREGKERKKGEKEWFGCGSVLGVKFSFVDFVDRIRIFGTPNRVSRST